MRTRDRILETALRLFNEQGYGAVTTAALAAECGIAEGNLWYHFKTKHALLEALSERFAAMLEARLAMPASGDALEDYVQLLAVAMHEFRSFRFFFRDQPTYGEHSELVRARAPQWLERSFDQLEARLVALADSGLLDWPRERLRDLAINATIILRYGLEHYRELGVPTEAGSGTVRRTLERHLTLFEHRLTPAAAARLHGALAEIESAALAA
ncbi:MAG: TetR/AcrR family transcriptional regulator [Proteobacteria bacterium]|nr:TetR/AcrR family transcriptional regulator [Pseudomonadota bacterium]